jgi:hypothetical protein
MPSIKSIARMGHIIKKTDMKTMFYIYKLTNINDGSYYIGSHFCSGKVKTCRTNYCRYMGSSSMIKETGLYRKIIIFYAKDRKDLSIAEKALLANHVKNPKCLNQIIASPSKSPTYTPLAMMKLKEAIRVKDIEVHHKRTGEILTIDRSSFSNFILNNYVPTSKVTWIQNLSNKTKLQISSNTLAKIWEFIEPLGWSFGYDTDFQDISIKDLLNTAQIKKVVTHNIEYKPIETDSQQRISYD